MLATKDAVIAYFEDVASRLPEYNEKTVDATRLQLRVNNVTLDVVLLARLESDRYVPYLATSDSEEATETAIGFTIRSELTRQATDDTEQVAANIRSALGEPDGTSS